MDHDLAPAIEFSTILAPSLEEIVGGTAPLSDLPIVFPAAVNHLASFNEWDSLGNLIYNDCNAAAWSNTRRMVTSKLGAEEIYPPLAQVLEFYQTQNPEFVGDKRPFKGDGGMSIQKGLQYLVSNGGPDGTRALAFARVDVTNPEAVKMAIATFGSIWVGLRVYGQTYNEFKDGKPWTQPSGDPRRPPDGHAVVVGGYDADYEVVSWGRQATLTMEYWNGTWYKQFDKSHRPNVFEGYVVVWPEHISTRRFMQGVSLKQLADQFQSITNRDMAIPESRFNSLYRCSGSGDGSGNVQLQIIDAQRSYAAVNGPFSTSIAQADASNGTLVTELNDLYLIRPKSTASSKVEIHRVLKPNFNKTVTSVSAFGTGIASNGVWTIDNGDLYFINATKTESGMIEVSWADKESKFTKSTSYVSGIALDPSGRSTCTISGGNLYQILDADNGSGFAEIASAKGYDSYSARSTVRQRTAFAVNDVKGQGSWTVGQSGDLYLLKTVATASGLVELHVATAASGYQELSHFSTGFRADGTGVWIL